MVATPWQAHPRLVHSFTVDGCGFLAVELPRVQWRLGSSRSTSNLART